MARVKGISIQTRLDFLHEQGFGPVLEKIVATLNNELADKLKSGILTSSWYDYGQFLEFLEAIELEIGKGDLALTREMGKYTAKKAFTGIYKILLNISSPKLLFRQAPNVWRKISDSGKARVHTIASRHLQFVLEEFPISSKITCVSIQGWLEGGLEMLKVKDGQVTIIHGLEKSDKTYEYDIQWK